MRVSKFTGGARRFGRAVLELPGTWRGSLQLRVVSLTLLLSIVIAFFLGWVLNNKIRDGLVQAKESSSLAMASSGFSEAQASIAAAEEEIRAGAGANAGSGGGSRDYAAPWVSSLDTMVRNLCSGANSDTYQVMLTSDDTQLPVAGYTCGGIQHQSIPDKLRAKLQTSTKEGFQLQYQTTDLYYGAQTDGATDVFSGPEVADHTTPGLLYGGEFDLPSLPASRPTRSSSTTPSRSPPRATRSTSYNEMIAIAGAVLVLALAGVAWFVTRLVVTPVRQAAGIAERLADGRFDERMRVRGEDDLARLATSFNTMAGNLQRQIRKLEELSRVQRRFVSDVSHELRTPLTTVRMAADVLHDAREDFTGRGGALGRAAADPAGPVRGAARRPAGDQPVRRRGRGARRRAGRPADAGPPGGRRLRGAGRAQGLGRASGWPRRRRAWPRSTRAASSGSCATWWSTPSSTARAGRCVVKVAASGEAVAVAVRDYGVGLKPGEATLVFDRFWRADPARARTTGGTGLGLAISLEDAHLHGGWLQAWGEPGGGSQFRLTLPRTAGVELVRSPIPLEPDDSRHHKRQAEAARAAAEGAAPRPPRATPVRI